MAPARADYQEGMAAYERGDYAIALREFRLAAERGQPPARGTLTAARDPLWTAANLC